MSEWQKITDNIVRSYFSSNERFNFYKLISEAEPKVRALIEGDDPDKKHVYLIPLDNGGLIEVDFHTKYTLVNEYDKDMKKSEVQTRVPAERGETALLRNFAAKLKKEKTGMGYPYPEALQNMLKALREGELFVFDNGTSFLCTKKEGNIVTLKRVCGNILGDSSVSSILSDGKEFDVDPSKYTEIQSLYRSISDHYTDSVRGRISNITVSKEYVKALIGGAEKNCDRRIDVGPVMMRLKKSFVSPAKIYDAEGKIMPDDKLQLLYAWMSNAPVITVFEHTDKGEHEFDDTRFSESIEQFFKDGKFDNVYRSICEYVIRLKGELKVEIKSYIRNEDDFYADGFQFAYKDGAVFMRRATYADNDLTHRIVALKKSPQRLFSDFCAEKFNSDFFLMKNNKRAVLRKSLPESEYIVE
ncbi:MAG: hypothetical protein J6I68_00485 [Butyrivibrio sp.]|uniref:hypothetical protein n=1 Tax=Butyrivibrio sp. TaxID=28121 RepID=UPI001B42A756|nr:hypothetical protein [Butyrivibrio sp.]MBP3781704.1 hypothetical protein [Butyrivibrio sp.]